MSALPHDLSGLGPVDDFLRDISPEELWPALERLVVEGAIGAPPWARVRLLGPWEQREGGGRLWVRWASHMRAGRLERNYMEAEVWLQEGQWFCSDSNGPGRVGPFPTRNEAMRHADGEARKAQWLHDGVIPPEEAPAAEPTPAPVHEAGPGRRVGQHRWSAVDGTDELDRCERCGRWRLGRQYWRAGATQEEALAVLERRAGDHVAGRCPGRQP